MTTTICIPFYNQLGDAKGIVALLKQNMSPTTELMVIDNGSVDLVEEFFIKYLKPKKFRYIRNERNIGMIKTMQQAYENCDTDILIVMHNDVFVYDKLFDERIARMMGEDSRIGIVGAFGSQGCGQYGERLQDVPVHMAGSVCAGKTNMLEAEVHGLRMRTPENAVAILDGFFMAFRMDFLRIVNGFDQRYRFHHFYDRNICLESLRCGYKNIVIDLQCHHLSGLTANRGDYQAWVDEQTQSIRGTTKDTRSGDKYTHDTNSQIFFEKWQTVTPLYVEDDFSFREGGSIGFRGDSIIRHNP